MEPCAENETDDLARIRLLGLGNEILADDAFGILVVREAERLLSGEIEAICSSASGFHLLDHLLGVDCLVIVDTIMTSAAEAGTIHVFRTDRFPPTSALAPHFVGLSEVLAVAKQLHLDVAKEVIAIAVEAWDCGTVGGDMHPAVRRAVDETLNVVKQLVAERSLRHGKV